MGTLTEWVPDVSLTGFRSSLNAVTPSSVTVSTSSIWVAPSTKLSGTAAPTAAPALITNTHLATAGLVLAVLGVVAVVIVVIVVVVIVILIAIQMKKTRHEV